MDSSPPDDDRHAEEPPETVEEITANPTSFDLTIEFDPGALEVEDIASVEAVVLSELLSAAADDNGILSGSRWPGFPGGGFTKHSKQHSKYGGHSKTRGQITGSQDPPRGDREEDEGYPVARPRPHSKTPPYSKSYSKYIFGKIG